MYKLMAERIVEVVWEDCAGSCGWQPRVTWPVAPLTVHSVGYVREESERGIVLTQAHTLNWRGEPRDDCATCIPRSQIKEVRELSRNLEGAVQDV